ncbi:hypothetical protein LTR36_008886 [Oleoguttula mirabilis]|uniref:F-box domain-containing protein n=1 Tax=Oleoguttula mirabilis TaxID=1507867 RepID=A0AAV9J8U3_9PEZI|nr:hypothetical protein LTR36_008886 [Oleoguttula mirabilis]
MTNNITLKYRSATYSELTVMSLVFNKAELLERILSHVPPRALLAKASRVCKGFNHAVETSIILQRIVTDAPDWTGVERHVLGEASRVIRRLRRRIDGMEARILEATGSIYVPGPSEDGNADLEAAEKFILDQDPRVLNEFVIEPNVGTTLIFTKCAKVPKGLRVKFKAGIYKGMPAWVSIATLPEALISAFAIYVAKLHDKAQGYDRRDHDIHQTIMSSLRAGVLVLGMIACRSRSAETMIEIELPTLYQIKYVFVIL